MTQRKTHTERAEQYAADVLAGKIPACLWVRLAAERQQNDLKKPVSDAFPWHFDAKKANKVCRFLEKFDHVKGAWARRREKMRLSDYQCFVVTTIFGWVNERGLRRFLEAYICVPRKNGKSFFAAGLANYGFAADDEPGAEVYSGATTEKQAWEVFRPAREMAMRNPDYLEHYGIEVNAKSLVKVDDGSRMEPIVGKPGDGASPHFAIADEFHEHDDSAQYDAMVTGMGAREQPLMILITTAGVQLAGPCYEKQQYAQDVLRGTKQDDRLFAIIYTIDDNDDWNTREAIRKANPNLNISVYEDYLLAKLQQAQQSAIQQNIFKTKHLNIWVGARTAWMPANVWRNEIPLPPIESLKGRVCYAGLDLNSTTDLGALVAIFPPETFSGLHYVYPWFYLPEDTIAEGLSPNCGAYAAWAKQGYLTLTEGNTTDYRVIMDKIRWLRANFMLKEVGFDPWQANQLTTELGQEGLTMVKVPQTVSYLSAPMKEVDALARKREIAHGNHPVLLWNITNVSAKTNDRGDIVPVRTSPDAKIDGAAALIIGMNRVVLNSKQKSPYEGRGVLTF